MNKILLTWGEVYEDFKDFETKWKETMLEGVYLKYSEEKLQQEIIKAYLEDKDEQLNKTKENGENN